jgi:hypothetical protein
VQNCIHCPSNESSIHHILHSSDISTCCAVPELVPTQRCKRRHPCKPAGEIHGIGVGPKTVREDAHPKHCCGESVSEYAVIESSEFHVQFQGCLLDHSSKIHQGSMIRLTKNHQGINEGEQEPLGFAECGFVNEKALLGTGLLSVGHGAQKLSYALEWHATRLATARAVLLR